MLAQNDELSWSAFSRGLGVAEYGQNNVGPISPYARDGLAERGIDLEAEPRDPIQAITTDFTEADLIIAVKESEHRPFMTQKFPQYADQVEYWHIHDLNIASASEALPILEGAVRGLIERLRA